MKLFISKDTHLNRNNNNFDILRLYLALAVLWHHLHYLISIEATNSIFNIFNPETAVRAFFVISGALIWQSAMNTKSYKSFFIKRFFRIYPAYITIIVISMLVSYFLFDAELAPTSSYGFWNAMTLNFVEPCIEGVLESNVICAQNGSLWTIKIEVLFYLFILVIVYFFKRISFHIYLYLSVISFILHLFFVYFDFTKIPLSILNQIPFLLFYFFLGSFLNDFFSKVRPIASLFILCIFSLLYYYSELFYPLFIVSFVFYIAYALPYHFNVNKFGDISYGLYIYHFPLIQFLVASGFFNTFSYGIAVSLTILLIISVSFLSWYLIEKPSLNYSKKLNKLI